jgi:hypothetical protein
MALPATYCPMAVLDDGSLQVRLPERVDLKEETGGGCS